jgi:hypothetical protein
MERNWIYKDDLGSEYGPYSREELERYADEGRVSHKGMIKDPEGNWSSPEDAGLELPTDENPTVYIRPPTPLTRSGSIWATPGTHHTSGRFTSCWGSHCPW